MRSGYGFGRRARGTVSGGNQLRSAKARASGKEFEAQLEATHEALVTAGVPLAVARAYPPVGGNPATGLWYAGPGQVDFVGAVRGRPVAFDAKSEKGAASYRHLERDYHELDFLLAWRRAGGLAFLLIRDAELGRVYLVDDVARLRAGESVQLREHARSGAAPVVRCLTCAPSAPVVWDWTTLLD